MHTDEPCFLLQNPLRHIDVGETVTRVTESLAAFEEELKNNLDKIMSEG
jgi:hypothetical protein